MDAHKFRISDPESQKRYKKRATSIELCFGGVKTSRKLTRFSHGGLCGKKTTISLWALLHNGLLWHDENRKTKYTNSKNNKKTT